jgi:hypothetical protein
MVRACLLWIVKRYSGLLWIVKRRVTGRQGVGDRE